MIETIKVWCEISLNDLKSAQLLYEHGQYRTSYFLFQQATEKANKACALLSGVVIESDLKGILHDQLKIYKKAAVKQEGEVKSFIEALKPFPHVDNHSLISNQVFRKHHASLLESVQFIDSLRNHDLINISLSDLNYFVRQLQQLKNLKIIIPKKLEHKFEKLMLNIVDWIEKFETPEAFEAKVDLMNLINDKEKSKHLLDFIVNEATPQMFDFIFIHFTLWICAILTIQHSSLSRYLYIPEKLTM